MAGIRVVMAGATGKTGSAVARALIDAQDVELVGALGYRSVGQDLGTALGGFPLGVGIEGDLASLMERTRPEVLVDFTRPETAGRHAIAAVQAGISPVIGTTAIPAAELEQLERLSEERGVGAVVVPNFSIGSLLLYRFARQAAEIFPRLEIIEKHHAEKIDAPSGTAKRLAEGLAERLGHWPAVHSVRLPGLVAHHEIIFGSAGETLTIRHDTISRDAFAPGVLLAVRKVRGFGRMVTDFEEIVSVERTDP